MTDPQPSVLVREVVDSDLDRFFDHLRDPQVVALAADRLEDPNDRQTFDAHWRRLRASDATVRTIEADSENGPDVVGHLVNPTGTAAGWSPSGSTGAGGARASPPRPSGSSCGSSPSGPCSPTRHATTRPPWWCCGATASSWSGRRPATLPTAGGWWTSLCCGTRDLGPCGNGKARQPLPPPRPAALQSRTRAGRRRPSLRVEQPQ